MTDDLVAFLNARLDEDEAAAKAAQPWPWRGALTDAHIARHDPARVLREVAAKRRIVERHKDCGTGYGYCDDGGHGHDGVGCAELLDLAAIDSDHPDCRSEWKP